MKTNHIIIFAFLLGLPFFGAGQDRDSPADFTGEWTIDLRPAPDAEGYYQAFVVTAIEGNTFTGTFYGSPIENGFINPNWDRLYFAFTTHDQSNDYYHSGYLVNGTVSGISYCPNRAFAAPWTGIKQ
jgi:hypothetical protein